MQCPLSVAGQNCFDDKSHYMNHRPDPLYLTLYRLYAAEYRRLFGGAQ
jgi:hypothetical protein